MRCLTMGWVGTSKALSAVRAELEAYGHRCADEGVDLVIDDGSQPLPIRWACTPRLSLRLGIGSPTVSELPVLQLRSYNHDHCLVAVLDIAEEPSGNGQHLCRRATRVLVEWVALQVSRFARDPQLRASPTSASDWPDQDLQSLDALAYLHRFNCTADPELLRAAQVPIIERLQASLITFAERPALNVAGEVVTYRQLQTQAWAIQQRLAALLEGVEGSAIVGVCLEKSAALYASILAILGCGAVYLPLAAQLPIRRQQLMLESAGARVLLDEGSHPLRERFMALDVRCADRQDATQPLPHPRPDPSAPCVVFFTSGTSGRPKGVRLSQGNLAHFTAWFGRCMALSEQGR